MVAAASCVFSLGFQLSSAKPVAPKAVMSMSGQMKNQPRTGKKAASSRMTEPRMNPFNGERLL